MNHLTVLYATDDMASRLHDTRAARDWEVFCPSNINEALAMAVYYAPHAVVIDGDSEWLNELAYNLTSATGPSARMKDIVVRIADSPLDLAIPEYVIYDEVSSNVTPDALVEALITLDIRREREGRCIEAEAVA